MGADGTVLGCRLALGAVPVAERGWQNPGARSGVLGGGGGGVGGGTSLRALCSAGVDPFFRGKRCRGPLCSSPVLGWKRWRDRQAWAQAQEAACVICYAARAGARRCGPGSPFCCTWAWDFEVVGVSGVRLPSGFVDARGGGCGLAGQCWEQVARACSGRSVGYERIGALVRWGVECCLCRDEELPCRSGVPLP